MELSEELIAKAKGTKTPKELAARLETVTREQVAAAARKLELDTVYFRKGQEQ